MTEWYEDSRPDLAVIVPTWGRPANAERLLAAFRRTCTARTSLILVAQVDDPDHGHYAAPEGLDAALWLAPSGVGGQGFVRPTNWAARRILAGIHHPFAVGYMGDDHVPQTVGWDSAYLAALQEMGTGYVWGDDLIQGERIPTQVAMTTDIVRGFGYLANPIVEHLYADNMWRDLGKAAGCARYLPEIIVEHRHYTWPDNDTPDDATYRIGNSAERWRDDPPRYNRWLSGPEFRDDLARLQEIMKAGRPE